MNSKTAPFRVGRVRVFRRGRIWYLAYFEQGQRRQPRVGPDRSAAKQMASEINGQLEVGAPSALGFEPISIAELRDRWLDNHEHVRRSSVHTIRRYRSATEHLLEFVRDVRPPPYLATEVIGKSLWDYISGFDVRRIYASVFKRVRQQQRTLSFPFRCDSPRSYRAMRLWVAPLSEGLFEFRAVLETLYAHPHNLDILSRSSAATSHSYPMCAWCKAIQVGTEWKPLETVLEELSLLTQEPFPTIMHDVCDTCLERYLQDDAADG